MNKIIRKIKAIVSPNSTFVGSQNYWEQRYATGGNSGAGSYNNLAEFKAEVINDFIQKNDIKTVIEFGCGDGNQLKYMRYPSYIGLDISKTIVRKCKELFKDDATKSFFIYDADTCVDNHGLFTADLTLSLDVLYHLIEDSVFESYMKQLFKSASKYVIIYSSDYEGKQAFHVKSRNFTKWVQSNIQGWQYLMKIDNKFPQDKNSLDSTSMADFYIYYKK